MIRRMIGAAMLNVNVYEEVESDRAAIGQALVVVVLAALATGIGTLTGGVINLVIIVVFGLIGWALWAGMTQLVGTTIFRTPETKSNWGQLARGPEFSGIREKHQQGIDHSRTVS